MIPHPSAGVQPWANQSRVPSGLRTDDLTGSRVDRPSMSGTPACPGQPVIDLTANDSGLPEGEPPNKRPRLATNVSGDGRTANRSATVRNAPPLSGGATRSATFSGRGRPACSFQDLLTETYGGGVLTGNAVLASQTPKPATPPPFPVRPWKYTPSQQTRASTAAANESTPEREVQTTVYRPEVPTIAPLIKNDREWFTIFLVSLCVDN
jgi:mediator of RNA polymerase II transcription subunit 12